MAKQNDNGGPAFPRAGYYPDTTDCCGDGLRERTPTITEPTRGMTLRDYFAAKAMAALLARGFFPGDSSEPPRAYDESHVDDDSPGADNTIGAGVLAEDAYRVADAMIAARNKQD